MANFVTILKEGEGTIVEIWLKSRRLYHSSKKRVGIKDAPGTYVIYDMETGENIAVLRTSETDIIFYQDESELC